MVAVAARQSVLLIQLETSSPLRPPVPTDSLKPSKEMAACSFAFCQRGKMFLWLEVLYDQTTTCRTRSCRAVEDQILLKTFR